MNLDGTTGQSTADEIIDFIRRNRVSTTEVADALGKKGVLEGVSAVNHGHHRVGPVLWVYAYDDSNWSVHEGIAAAPEGSVVVVSHFNTNGRSAVGDLVAKYLLLYRGCHALVADGPVRDAHQLKKEDWPVWCRGFNPVGCFKDQPDRPLPPGALEDERRRFEGAIAVCDDGGVVVIEQSEISPVLLQRLRDVEAIEDQWYDGIDRLKLSTFDVICRGETEGEAL